MGTTDKSPGTGGSIPHDTFWIPLRKILAEQGWRISQSDAFPVVAVKRDWVIGMIDAHAHNAGTSFKNLNTWATEKNISNSKLLVAVYLQTSADEVKAVKALHDGNRMGPQAMGAAYQLVGGQFYPPNDPVWSAFSGYSGEILYDTDVDRELQEALRKTLSPR